MKKTKIIATIGPSSSSREVMKEMIIAGADVFRLNLSHASLDFCKEVIDKVREIEKELHKTIGIMVDIPGPTVRIDELKEDKVYLNVDDELKIYSYPVLCNNIQLSFNYPEVVSNLEMGDIILLSDGLVELEVIEISNDYAKCRVNRGGNIVSKQTVHLKEKQFSIPFLSDNDKESIMFSIRENIDFLALSYVNSEQDVLKVVDMLIENDNNHMEIISKIENASALNNLEDILKVSDGVMVARDDLAIEMSLERLPFFQKTILSKAKEYEKISIVATDLLMSMETNMQPARAEVSDIYNAVMDNCDAVLLSGETTIGDYPVESVRTMNKVIMSAEEDFDYNTNLVNTLRDTKQDITSSIAYAVVDSSLRLRTSAIIANTNSGYTAKKISHFHPSSPILGLSPSVDAAHSLTIVYGVVPRVVSECHSTDMIVNMCIKEAIKTFDLINDDLVVITGGFPISNKNTNFMKIEVIDIPE